MPPDSYRDQRVLVMGLGLHGGGVGIARFFCDRGARVTVTDLRPESDLRPSLDALSDCRIEFVLGEHRAQDFREANLIVRNPAVPAESPYLAIAREHGVPIDMEMGIFFRECDPTRIIGITGTRGKSTTATFVQHLLEHHDVDAVLAGNIRRSAVTLLDGLKPRQTVVLELSSWQLEALDQHQLSPGVAVITNVLPDHLNRYPDMDAYAAAKGAIVRYQSGGDLAVLNRDNQLAAGFATSTAAEVRWFSPDDDLPGWEDARVAGDHNQANLAAAIAATARFDIPAATIARAVASFKGVPYRQQQISVRNGVRYINDTCSTTPDATLAALATVPGPIVLIAGGSDKRLNFDALSQRIVALGPSIRSIILFPGEGTARMRPGLPPTILHDVATMDEAVSLANRHARPGDAVLLSPACASFGTFKNEFDRGDQFNDCVMALAEG